MNTRLSNITAHTLHPTLHPILYTLYNRSYLHDLRGVDHLVHLDGVPAGISGAGLDQGSHHLYTHITYHVIYTQMYA